jgi:hypothetical protein
MCHTHGSRDSEAILYTCIYIYMYIYIEIRYAKLQVRILRTYILHTRFQVGILRIYFIRIYMYTYVTLGSRYNIHYIC